MIISHCLKVILNHVPQTLRNTLNSSCPTPLLFPTAAEVLLLGDTGFIRPEGNEKTYRLKQRDIINEVDMNTAKNAMDFQLTKFGPYNLNYSKNGRYNRISALSASHFSYR
jgi:U3 small nucleolar RNA-associated protein 7